MANRANDAQIEICYGNFSACFEQSTCFSLTGADLDWHLDGVPLRLWRSYWVNAGGTLTAATPRSGLRSYLAVSGGFQVANVLGSCATVGGDKLGGLHDGQSLQADDSIGFMAAGKDAEAAETNNRIGRHFIPDYWQPVTLRVVPGNQFEQFSPSIRQQFFNQCYKLSNRADRMGCRLEGQSLRQLPGNMVSEAVPLGAIQIPGDGQPIVLLNDRQTIGGYPKLGNVYALDLHKLAQCKPGDEITFTLGNLAEAQNELRLFKQFFDSGLSQP